MGKKKAPDDFRCANAGCPVTGRDKVNKRCARCLAVFYCSRDCQRQHWSSRGGNHKGYCKAAPKPEAAVAAAPSGRGQAAGAAPPSRNAGNNDDDLDPAHPCPICLVNEDDRGVFGMCDACGQLYCGDCNVAEGMGRIKYCPTCRAPFRVSDAVAVNRLKKLAVRSPGRHTPVAQYNLGTMYKNGLGVPQDYAEAVRWYRLAADQGNARAHFNLAVMYNNGTGVPQDDAEAVRLYQLAADQGHAKAQYNLGVMYANGNGASQDHTEAVRLFQLAADQGHAMAQYNLALMYANGAGVPQDDAEAVRWYRLAVDQGLNQAQCNLGWMYADGAGVPQDFAEAARLLTLAHDQGCLPAEPLLGQLTARWFPVGTRVQVEGLVAAAVPDGSLGTVVLPATPLAAGRIAVRIDGQTKITSVSWAKITRFQATADP